MAEKALTRSEVQAMIDAAAKKGQFTSFNTSRHEHNGSDSPRVHQADIIPQLRASGSITMQQTTRYTFGLSFNPTNVLFYGNVVHYDGITFALDDTYDATVGAVYEVDGVEYTVVTTISGGTSLTTTADEPLTNPPPSSGTLTLQSGTGDASIDYTSYSLTINLRAFVTGSACLGASYYFRPESSTSVTSGGTILNVIQSGASMLASETSLANFTTVATEGHLLQVRNAFNSIVAELTIPNLSTVASVNGEHTDKGYGNGFLYVDAVVDDQWQINGNFVIT